MDAETKASPESARRTWVAALLMQRPALFHRFQNTLECLSALPRGARRRLWRGLATRATWAALLLALGAGPLLVPRAHAAAITVAPGTVTVADDAICSLSEAIVNANDTTTGLVHDDCAAGSPAGADVLTLTGNVKLVTSYGGDTGLPFITSVITIEGAGFTVARDSGAPAFRLMGVASNGDLTLQNVTLSGGYVISGHGGGINSQGPLTLTGSTITDSYGLYGGAIYNSSTALNLTNSTVSGNSAGVGGGIYHYSGTMNLTHSTVSANSALAGGGIYNNDGTANLTNSTVSGNQATDGRGGGIYTDVGDTTLVNSTVTDNTATWEGGGTWNWYSGSSLTLVRSIIAGNSAGERGDEVASVAGAALTVNEYNVFGHSVISNGDAFHNFTPGASDFVATSDNDGAGPDTATALAAILATTLADNGGPTETHNLVAGSPAVDFAPGGDCAAAPTNGVDQRGTYRPFGPGCDAGAVEYGSSSSFHPLFVSASTAGVTDDAVAFGPHDILMWHGSGWSKWFDGTAAGLTPNGRAKHNINAIHVDNPGNPHVFMSFAQNARFVPGIFGKVDGMDVVVWDGASFQLVFDGQDVGLTNLTQEKIDAIHILDGTLAPAEVIAAAGGSCQVYMLVSTQGPGRVTNYDGTPLRFGGEDVLGFCFTSNGDITSGVWHKLVDGSDQGMPRNATVNLSASDDGLTIYLTTRGAFNVDTAAGGHSMVYEYDVAGGAFSGPVFSAPANGLHNFVDALQY